MDKELALIISEMLIKQDETTAQIKETNDQIRETNNILRDFMGLSVKHWEQQQTFNEILANELKDIKNVLSTLAQLDVRLKALEERESRFETRLANIEKLLKAS